MRIRILPPQPIFPDTRDRNAKSGHHGCTFCEEIAGAFVWNESFLKGTHLQRRAFVFLVGVARAAAGNGAHEDEFDAFHWTWNSGAEPAGVIGFGPGDQSER